MTDTNTGTAASALHPLDPALARRALALVEGGTTDMADHVLRVPLAYYRDQDLFRRERDEILATTPIAAVPSTQVALANTFVVRELVGRSVLVTRDEGGRAHAFLNYCRHRGARVASGCGSARRFTCPYHAWNYDTAGRLTGMPGAEGFTGIDASSYGLVELPSEERHGFVWTVLTPGCAIDVAAHLGPLDAELAVWGFEHYEYLTEREFDARVNWKSALEAFAESYHFPYVHRDSLINQNTIANTATFDAYGLHHRLGFACPWIRSAGGAAELGEPLNCMALIYWLFPNLVVAVSAVGVELIDILPGEDPTRCHVRHGWMAKEPAADDATRAGYEALYEAVHAAVRDEDFSMLPSCTDGIRHAGHDHMLIGRNEIGVQHVVRTFARALSFAL